MEMDKEIKLSNHTPAGENFLASEHGPYLLQHKDNPVWWHPWGEAAFERAKKENKLIFLSIGYSTCHWCHVMNRESFENHEIAELLNKGFVCIKVDREERPDIDQLYMSAMQAMGINGGWPLSVFLTPDLKPFWGGTYFTRDQLRSILIQLAERWIRHEPEFYKASNKLFTYLEESTHLSRTDYSISEKLLSNAFVALKRSFDPKFGGFGKAPKFPPATRLRLLMRMSRRNAKERENRYISEMLERTMTAMFQGGVYDHLGGGFSRYSTDEMWLVPHFEKMLYDNANLALTYIEGFQLTGNPLYEEVAKDILNYAIRDLGHGDGGFYSAEDAESEGEEGRFYVWQYEEIKELLNQEEFEQVKLNYSLTAEGNFLHASNILNIINNHNPRIVFSPTLRNIKQKLLDCRNKRIRPLRDEKILTGINGLMLAPLAKAFQVFRNERYLELAQKTATFIREHMDSNRQLKRRYFQGKVGIEACLEDYVYLIDGLIHLYESDFNPEWLRWAIDLQTRQDELLWSDRGAYYSSTENSNTVLRTIDIEDGANPNPNGLSILNLLRFYHFTYDENYLERAIRMLKSIGPVIEKYPAAFAQALMAVDFFLDKAVEIAVVGDKNSMEYVEILGHLHKSFLPNKVLALKDIQLPSSMTEWPELLGRKKMMEGKTTTYVCEKGTCFKHTSSVIELKKQLANFQYLNLD